ADSLRQTLGDDWTPAHDQALGAILGGRSISAFQFRSATRLLQNHAGLRGTVVAAGTGAGKTLAFYLPALTRILAEPRAALVPRIIAIYPRTELLRDQLRSVLLVGDSLRSAGVQPPRVGVLYGATPWNRTDATTEQRRRRRWKQVGAGLVFPIVAC